MTCFLPGASLGRKSCYSSRGFYLSMSAFTLAYRGTPLPRSRVPDPTPWEFGLPGHVDVPDSRPEVLGSGVGRAAGRLPFDPRSGSGPGRASPARGGPTDPPMGIWPF